VTPDELRALARRGMLPWLSTREVQRHQRLALHEQARRIENEEDVIDKWWDSTEKTGVMAEDIERLKALLKETS
jgi:uncharacterized membrane protein